MASQDPFGVKQPLDTPLGQRQIAQLNRLPDAARVDKLPYCIKVMLEAVLRKLDGFVVTEDHARALCDYDATKVAATEIPFSPGRVVLQDFTGVPAVVDLAAMRDAMRHLGGNPDKVNPLVPCDLVIDHSVQVDAFASDVALTINSEKEFQRNNERYSFLKWGQQAFDNFRVVPPATGIVHQVNLEYLAKVVWETSPQQHATTSEQGTWLYPDSLVGTDSHTTMINGLGVVGWGVGGIEAEAVMMGQPIYMLIPEVVGFKLTGKLAEGATATDLVLCVTQMLRQRGVVGKFVEFFGPGMANMPVANRATIANMAPEYGATMGFFPVDDMTLDYLRLTARDDKLIDTVKQYCQLQGLWRSDDRDITYTDVLELDLGDVEPSLAGPRRPQDRIALSAMQSQWKQDMDTTFGRASAAAPASTGGAMQDEGGAVATADAPSAASVKVDMDGQTFELADGHVVIAAITSCTNTSNPDVMLAAGVVAQKARRKGLTRKPWVKTSLAPGSKVVTEYLNQSGLMDDLEAQGFHLVGYGCTTCIGNSGPLPPEISKAVNDNDLVVASVLSGNRNFEGRVNPDVRANYLASPPLVVAYALAGTVDIDLANDPIGTDNDGNAVYLKDIWPTQKEILDLVRSCVTAEQFSQQYASVFQGSNQWQQIDAPTGSSFAWDDESTYVQQPPFFLGMGKAPEPVAPIQGARCLAKLGDSVTTDHISPAGSIKADAPAGKYLQRKNVPVSMFNSYGSRRGNHEIMMRGTLANIRVRNQLAPGTEGGYTTYMGPDTQANPDDTFAPDEPVRAHSVTSIYDAAMAYRQNQIPTIILAGNDYGMGSSRDWAAKGTQLLGVRAVIAQSYERIHRSNLVGMGVLPLQFDQGDDPASLGLKGDETFDINLPQTLEPGQTIRVTARRAEDSGQPITFNVRSRIDTPVEVEYYNHGGILHAVLRQMAGQ